jgi:hypothetical protein
MKSSTTLRKKRTRTNNSKSTNRKTNRRTKRRINSSLKSHFLEDNLDLLFDSLNGKTVGLMSGCFCPPHKGHYNSFLKMLQNRELDLDILILESLNDEKPEKSRHGTPLSHTNFALDMFAKYLEEKTGKNVLVRNAPGALYKDKGYNLLQYPYIPLLIKKVYRLTILDEKYEKSPSKPKTLNQLSRILFRNLRNGNEDKYEQKIFYRREIEKNSVDKLSATKFVKAIKEGEDVSKFINHLSKSDQDKYISETLKYSEYLQ